MDLLDLDTSWIEKEEKRFSIELNNQKTPMDSISCVFVYMDEHLSIQKVVKDDEKLVSIDSGVGIYNSRILQIIQQRRHLINGIKYKNFSIFKYVVDLDVESINEFTYTDTDTIVDWYKEVSLFNDVLIEPSIFIFHPLNSLYFFFKQDIMVIQSIKSILRINNSDNENKKFEIRSTKKLRIDIIDSSFEKEKPFTPFRIEDAQSASPSPLITARKAGVLNEKRCKKKQTRKITFS